MKQPAFQKKLGARIIKLREGKQMSQSDLARLSGKDRQSIYRLEKGLINPSAFYLHEVAEAMEVPMSELFL